MKKRMRKYLPSLHTTGIKSRGINLCLHFCSVSANSLQLRFDKKKQKTKLGYLVHLKLCPTVGRGDNEKHRDTKIIPQNVILTKRMVRTQETNTDFSINKKG
jgi:hypothetical protein